MQILYSELVSSALKSALPYSIIIGQKLASNDKVSDK